MNTMPNALQQYRICFLGAGSMAEAIIRGLVADHRVKPTNLIAVNRSNEQRRIELKQRYGIQIAGDDEKFAAVRESDLIVLAMKPKDAASALAELRPFLQDHHLIVSVIAGLSIKGLQSMAGKQLPIVRTMPNTSSTIGLGATGISFSPQVNKEQQIAAIQLFESIGIVKQVHEDKLDVVTGLSGSGPAYIYYIIEAMTAAGIEGGLPREVAYDLAVQTVLGAVEMIRKTQEDPAVLRRKVTSPGGTTEAALKLMEDEGMATIFKRAIHRATERARELDTLSKHKEENGVGK